MDLDSEQMQIGNCPDSMHTHEAGTDVIFNM